MKNLGAGAVGDGEIPRSARNDMPATRRAGEIPRSARNDILRRRNDVLQRWDDVLWCWNDGSDAHHTYRFGRNYMRAWRDFR